jgi:hypothetical protein
MDAMLCCLAILPFSRGEALLVIFVEQASRLAGKGSAFQVPIICQGENPWLGGIINTAFYHCRASCSDSLSSCSLSSPQPFSFDIFHLSYFLFPFFNLLFSLFLSFSHFFSLFFYSKAELEPSLVRINHVTRCSPISPALGPLCLTTLKIKYVMLEYYIIVFHHHRIPKCIVV